MDSRIATLIRSTVPPIATVLSDVAPEGATQFKEGRWGCVMWLASAAFKGRAAVADVSTFGCLGGGTGLGFGNQYRNWQGGIECFYRFLSTGNPDAAQGPARRPGVRDLDVHGERYVKDPALVKEFVDGLPIVSIDRRYVVFKPLSQVDPAVETPEVVHFLVDPDRLSALVCLANYSVPGNDNVIVPWAAACQSMGILAMREARSERQRAVVGNLDISARKHMDAQFGPGFLTVSIPFAMFNRMEADAPGSFLETSQWTDLLDARGVTAGAVASTANDATPGTTP